MIKIGNIGIDEVNYQGNISKALKGTELIWEKNQIKTISWLYQSQLSPFSESISIYDEDVIRQIKDKIIIDITIGNYGSIEIGEKFYLVNGQSRLSLRASLEELLGVKDFIPRNTRMTIRYK